MSYRKWSGLDNKRFRDFSYRLDVYHEKNMVLTLLWQMCLIDFRYFRREPTTAWKIDNAFFYLHCFLYQRSWFPLFLPKSTRFCNIYLNISMENCKVNHTKLVEQKQFHWVLSNIWAFIRVKFKFYQRIIGEEVHK